MRNDDYNDCDDRLEALRVEFSFVKHLKKEFQALSDQMQDSPVDPESTDKLLNQTSELLSYESHCFSLNNPSVYEEFTSLWKIVPRAWTRLDFAHETLDEGSWFRHRMFVLTSCIYLLHSGAMDYEEYEQVMSKWERPKRKYRRFASKKNTDCVAGIERDLEHLVKNVRLGNGFYEESHDYSDAFLKDNLMRSDKKFPMVLDEYNGPDSVSVKAAAKKIWEETTGRGWSAASWGEQQNYLNIAHDVLAATLSVDN